MQKSEHINELAGALAKAQALIEGAVKDKSNPAFRSKYADLGAIWDCIREPLASNGLSVVQLPRAVENGVEVETVLMHASGQWISSAFWVPVTKGDAHGFMSATTYGRRGGLSAMCGVAPVDDDGNGATGRRDDGASDTPVRTPPRPVPPQPAPAAKANGNGQASAHQPGNIDAETRNGAAVMWVEQSTAALKALRSKEEVTAWWKANKKHIDRLEEREPALHEKLVVAYDDAFDSKPSLAMAG